MQKLQKSISTLFWVSLGMSVGFPLGVLGIIFGAVFFIIPLLVIGIVLTCAGFYVMPIMWVKYGERRGDRTLLFMIENEHIYTVSALARQTGYKEANIRERITGMIHRQELVGYLFHDDMLELNTNVPQTEDSRRTRHCPQCGASMLFDGIKFRCEYCGHTEYE